MSVPQTTYKFKMFRHYASTVGLAIIGLCYFAAAFADLIAPYDHLEQVRRQPSAPASTIHFIDAEGSFHFQPFIYERRMIDPRERIYEEDTTRPFFITLFSEGEPHNLLGLIRTRTHLFGVSRSVGAETPRINLLGTDQLGRDRFSRLLFAMRFSLFVSPVGTLLACVIGIGIGAASGYAGRTIDTVLMGIADTMIALPSLILILAARAAFPPELPAFTAAVLIISIFALTGWAEMARLTRGLVVSIKRREFVIAGRSIGLTETRLLWRHILPNIASPLMIQATLMLPAFLLAEIALSFLGVGLQEPEASLGNMLSSAADISMLRNSPFLLLSPAIVIFLFVLGIRLAARRRSGTVSAGINN